MENESVVPPTPPSRARIIFVGKNGIRAGWSIAIFIIILVAISMIFVGPVSMILRHEHIAMDGSIPLSMGSTELALLLGVLISSFIMTRIEHKPPISYGLDGPQRLRNFLWGLAFGFLSLSVLVAVLMVFGLLRFDGVRLSALGAVRYAAEWGVVFLLVGMYEEYTLRGYLLATLSRGIGFWWSAVILSVVFGSLHFSNSGESPVGIFSAGAIGLLFCLSLWYLKTLWWAIGFHAAWDWAESYFWGTPDSGLVSKGHLIGVHSQGSVVWSGGATGPEGSLLIVPLLIIIAVVMVLAWRNKRIVPDSGGASGQAS